MAFELRGAGVLPRNMGSFLFASAAIALVAGGGCNAIVGVPDYEVQDGLKCGDELVDVRTDPRHCGACDTPVPPGGVCTQGKSGCTGGKTDCGGACADVKTDKANCGGCGKSCTGGTCTNGACVCPASASTTCSKNGCADLQSDGKNCGACENDCGVVAPGTSGKCLGGKCDTSCAQGLTSCGGKCVDTSSTASACGPSCVVCSGSTPTCQSGVCVGKPSSGGAGDKCSTGSQCNSGDCVGWCQEACSPANAACLSNGKPSNSGNGRVNYCVETVNSTFYCYPSCSSGSDCTVYANSTKCTMIPGKTMSVCAP